MPAEINPSLQLQINNSGAWKTIARFEANTESRRHFARLAVEHMALVDPKMGTWRIATCDGLPQVLEDFSVAKGWAARQART